MKVIITKVIHCMSVLLTGFRRSVILMEVSQSRDTVPLYVGNSFCVKRKKNVQLTSSWMMEVLL